MSLISDRVFHFFFMGVHIVRIISDVLAVHFLFSSFWFFFFFWYKGHNEKSNTTV